MYYCAWFLVPLNKPCFLIYLYPFHFFYFNNKVQMQTQYLKRLLSFSPPSEEPKHLTPDNNAISTMIISKVLSKVMIIFPWLFTLYCLKLFQNSLPNSSIETDKWVMCWNMLMGYLYTGKFCIIISDSFPSTCINIWSS